MSNEKEKAFSKWKANLPREMEEEMAWLAGWNAARESQLVETIRSVERAKIREKLMLLAVEIFKEGNTQKAQIVRDLSDIRHSIWPEPL